MITWIILFVAIGVLIALTTIGAGNTFSSDVNSACKNCLIMACPATTGATALQRQHCARQHCASVCPKVVNTAMFTDRTGEGGIVGGQTYWA